MDIALNNLTKAKVRVMIANPVGELGGAEQVVLALAERLPAYGIEVSFALLRPGPLQQMIESRKMRVYVFPEEYRYRDLRSIWRCVRWLTRCIKEDGADLLHSNLTAHFIGGWAAKLAKVPELWHLHDHAGHFDPVHAIARKLPVDYTVFITEHVKSGEPGLPKKRHRTIHPDCVDVEMVSAMAPDPSVRERLGIGDSPFFLTATRLQQHKGHSFLIAAAAELKDDYPELKWVVAGRPNGKEQEAYLRTLREQVVREQLEDRVLFVGFLGPQDLFPLYREALALVHPAITEGYGLVLLEAMASGLPVIAAAATGPAEIIEDGQNGLLVPVQDASALAAAQRRILTDDALVKGIRIRASIEVKSRSLDRMVEETIACYREMLA